MNERPIVDWFGLPFTVFGYGKNSRGILKEIDIDRIDISLINTNRKKDKKIELNSQVREKLENMKKGRRNVYQPKIERNSIEVFNLNPQSAYNVCYNHNSYSDDKVYDILYSVYEAESIPSEWVSLTEGFDELWTPSEFARDSFLNGGVDIKTNVMPEGVEDMNEDSQPLFDFDEFTFISLFDFTYRKGWDKLIKAYCDEFQRDEDVRLFFKTSYYGDSKGDYITRNIRKVKKECKYNPKITITGERISEEDMSNFYNSGDVFVLPCFSQDTEILTEEGFKEYINISKGDSVLTFNPKKDTIEKDKVKNIWINDYDGDLIHLKNTQIDLLVTPNHRIYYSTPKKRNEWKVRKASEFPSNKKTRYYLPTKGDWKGKNQEKIKIEKLINQENEHGNTKLLPKELDIRALFEIIGWYISEGSIYEKNGEYRVSFSNTSRKNQNRIIDSLKELNLRGIRNKSRKDYQGVIVSSKLLVRILKECGTNCYEKRIPNWVLEYDSEFLQHLYKTMMLGDGSRKGNHVNYYTTSDQLKDNFVELCLKLGFTTKTFKRVRDERELENRILPKSEDWMISVREKNHKGTLKCKKDISKVSYRGKIWSIETNNKTVITRRNGLVSISGNSRGEGFGLPIYEAASCGLPVIITNYSAPTDFINDAYWVDYELKEYPFKEAIKHENNCAGLKFANPNINSLRKQMRKVFERDDLKVPDVSDLTWNNSARKIENRLEKIWRNRISYEIQ